MLKKLINITFTHYEVKVFHSVCNLLLSSITDEERSRDVIKWENYRDDYSTKWENKGNDIQHEERL